MSLQSTQYFLGNTEIIQSFVGDKEIVFNPKPIEPYEIVISGLKHYFNANQNATTSSWQDTLTTASANFQVGVSAGTLRYNQNLPSASYYDFVSSSTSNDMFFGRAPIESDTDVSVFMVVNPKKDTDLQLLNGFGVSGGVSTLAALLIVSGNLGYDNGQISSSNSPKTGSLPKLDLNEWYQVGYTFDSTSSIVTLYVNQNSSAFTDTLFIGPPGGNLFWLIGEERGASLYSGSVATQMIYTRVLSPTEVSDNYNYFNQFYN
jgi:hypothetical protein